MTTPGAEGHMNRNDLSGGELLDGFRLEADSVPASPAEAADPVRPVRIRVAGFPDNALR